MKHKTKLKVVSLGGTVLISMMVNAALIPVLPAIRSALNLTLPQVSMLVVFVNVPAAIFAPVGGYLADLLGRKTVIVPSLLLFGDPSLL